MSVVDVVVCLQCEGLMEEHEEDIIALLRKSETRPPHKDLCRHGWSVSPYALVLLYPISVLTHSHSL